MNSSMGNSIGATCSWKEVNHSVDVKASSIGVVNVNSWELLVGVIVVYFFLVLTTKL